jgi:hypothetical protein
MDNRRCVTVFPKRHFGVRAINRLLSMAVFKRTVASARRRSVTARLGSGACAGELAADVDRLRPPLPEA